MEKPRRVSAQPARSTAARGSLSIGSVCEEVFGTCKRRKAHSCKCESEPSSEIGRGVGRRRLRHARSPFFSASSAAFHAPHEP